MEGFFSIVGTLLGGLFAVAVLVAGWEHLRRSAGGPPPSAEPPKAARVDVDVEHLAQTQGDTRERQRALEGALNRASTEAVPWLETTPAVAAATLAPAPETASGKH